MLYILTIEKVKVLVPQFCLTLCGAMGCQVPLSMGFSRQESWSGWPFLSPGDLLDPGIKLMSLHCRQILYHLHHQGSPAWLWGGCHTYTFCKISQYTLEWMYLFIEHKLYLNKLHVYIYTHIHIQLNINVCIYMYAFLFFSVGKKEWKLYQCAPKKVVNRNTILLACLVLYCIIQIRKLMSTEWDTLKILRIMNYIIISYVFSNLHNFLS